MKVEELVESRRANWVELELLCERLETKRRLDAAAALRFSALYRDACADLALATAWQLPAETIQYLHRLIGRAHNQFYRSRTFAVSNWGRQLIVEVPRRLFSDNYLRLAFVVFFGIGLLSAFLAHRVPRYATELLGKEMMEQMEEMYSQPFAERGMEGRTTMAGFYIWNNMGIGLRCFALGLAFGVGGLYVLGFNAAYLGAVFGHMLGTKQWDHFSEFVTAHSPFELTAIVLSAAAGMRLGFSLVDTLGRRRLDSLRAAAAESTPVMGASLVMFFFAALIEAFVSPSPLPYAVKAGVAAASLALLLFYLVGLGYRRGAAA